MPTSVRLPAQIDQRLNVLAARTGRSKAFYIREMILNHIDDVEDYYLAAHVTERLRQGKERTFTGKQLRRDLGKI